LPDTATHFINHPKQVETHGQLVDTGLIHMAGEAKQTSATVFWRSEVSEPLSSIQNDWGNRTERLYIIKNGG
jgi:hypothetical protein